MNKKTALIAAAAMTGLLAGSSSSLFASTSNPTSTPDSKDQVKALGQRVAGHGKIVELGCNGKHECKGQNECKGQGGCKTGDNGCKGKNSCKGKGGCNTMHDQGEEGGEE